MYNLLLKLQLLCIVMMMHLQLSGQPLPNTASSAFYPQGSLSKMLNTTGEWQETNGPARGRTNNMYVDGERLYISTNCGVYFSDDKAVTWKPSLTGLTLYNTCGEMDKMGDTLILQNAFLKYSSDSGASWQNFAVDPPSLVQHILVNGNSIFACGYFGIYRSDDFGQTWINLSGLFIANTHFASMLKVGNAIFATTNADLWKSTNNGNSWVSVLNTTALSKLRFYGGRMFISHGANDLMSADTGATFLPLIVPSGTGPGNYIASDSIIYAGFSTQGTHVSYDLGATWVNAEVNLFDTGTVDFALIDSTVFCANKRGGVFVTTLGDSVWTEKNYNLPLSQITSVSASANDVLAFTYDAGDLLRSDDKGLSWSSVISNLPPNIDIKSILNEDSVYFIATTNYGVYKSSDHGLSWNTANTGLTSTNILDIVRKGMRLFVSQGTGGAAFISDDEGATWTPSSTGFQFAFAEKFFVDGSRIYAKSGFNIYYSDNDGASWDSIVRTGCPSGAGPDVIGRVGNKLLALFHSNGIFMFDSTTVSWSEITNQFGNDNCNDFLIVDSTIVFAHATGVYTSDNLGATWTLKTSALFYDICSNDSTIYGGANGGGVWKYDLFSAPSALSYYWVGGTGNWSDFANHWATTSGGTTFHVQPPTINDDVYFDANSFSATGESVNLDVGCALHNMDWRLVTNTPTFSGQQFINVSGSLWLSPNMIHTTAKNYVFNSSSLLNEIQTGGQTLYKIEIAGGGTWKLLDSLVTENFSGIQNFHIADGIVNLNGNYLKSSEIDSPLPTSGLDMAGGTLEIDYPIEINLFNGANSKVIYNLRQIPTYTYLRGQCDEVELRDSTYSNNPLPFGLDINNFSCKSLHYNGTAGYNFNNEFTLLNASGGLVICGDSSRPVSLSNNSATYASIGTQTSLYGVIYDTLSINPLADTVFVGTVIVNDVFEKAPSSTLALIGVSGNTLSKASGQLCLSNVSIKDINATGGATFNADNSCVDLGGNTGWNFLTTNCVTANAYYWVGGSGNWNDVSHWATTSGGNLFYATPPGSTDDVFFDNNSFLSNTDTVYDSGYNQCNSFHLNSAFTPYFYFTIYATSSVEMHTILDGLIGFVFKGTGTGNTILTGGNNCVLQFDSAGTWQLSDDFSGYISILAPATLYTNSHAVNINETDFFNQNGGTIYFGSSIVTMSSPNSILYSQNPAQIFGDSASFYINGLFSHYQGLSDHSFKYINAKNISLLNDTVEKMVFTDSLLNFSGCHIKELEVVSASSNALLQNGDLGFADNYIQKLILSGSSCVFKTDSNSGVFNRGWHIDTLFMANGGASITIHAGDTIYINDQFFKNGNSIGTIQSSVFGQSAYMYKSTGSVCLDYMEISDNSAIGGATFNAGANSINATNNNGWLFTACTNLSDVWPGDANYDLTISNFDILNLGLSYNETGPIRAGASLAYVAQPAADWNGFFQTAVNKKHADTNGDGIVDDNDTTAVSLNYGLTHPARMGNTQLTASPTDPYLYLSVNPDSANLSDTIYIETFFGTSQIPVDSVYGLAFTINYDTTLVDTSWISTQFLNSWFGQPGIDLITFSKSIPLEQKIDVAIVRTDHNNTTGFGGPLCRTGIVIVDNVAGRMPLPITLSNPRALTASEYELAINIGGDTVSVDTTTGIVQHGDPTFAIRLFPNPAKNKLYIVTNSNSVYNYQLLDMFGNIILSNNGVMPQKSFSISSPGKGMYILQLLTSNGMVARKVVFME